jgi:hypothetical protein
MPDLATLHSNRKYDEGRLTKRWHTKKLVAVATIAPLPSIEVTGRVLAEIVSYDDLWRSVRDRVDSMRLTRDQVCDRAGLPDRYVAKILGPSQIRKFGNVSLGPTLGAICCKLILVEDVEATAKMMSRSEKRQR